MNPFTEASKTQLLRMMRIVDFLAANPVYGEVCTDYFYRWSCGITKDPERTTEYVLQCWERRMEEREYRWGTAHGRA